MVFTKMHGCGNDYILVNCLKERVENPDKVAQLVSDRHFGIGSDGLILIRNSEVSDFKMCMYNADGSEGRMCGNGIRCIGKYIYDNGLTNKSQIKIETLSGIKTLKLNISDSKVKEVTVNMGAPITDPTLIPALSYNNIIINESITVLDVDYRITAVSMGNPHCILFVDDVNQVEIEKIGPRFEHHTMFPDRVNTEFVRVIDRNSIEMRVWERGSGETLSCGTGACASVVACVLNNLTEDEVVVHLRGGDLLVNYNREEGTVYMTGGAEVICVGEYKI